jgi:hypothetical protein
MRWTWPTAATLQKCCDEVGKNSSTANNELAAKLLRLKYAKTISWFRKL